jgi:hypothetical protein
MKFFLCLITGSIGASWGQFRGSMVDLPKILASLAIFFILNDYHKVASHLSHDLPCQIQDYLKETKRYYSCQTSHQDKIERNFQYFFLEKKNC